MTSAQPRITANALIRYCSAKAPERNRIIHEFRDAEYPIFKGWYGETEGAIRRHFAASSAGDSSLSDLESVLEKRPAASDFDESRILKQLEALEAARNVDTSALQRAGTVSALQDSSGPLLIHGVRVSVRPTNLIQAHQPGFKHPFVGVVKPYLSSSTPLDGESAALFGALLHWYAELQLAHIGEAGSALCFVVDIFAKKVFQAPKSYKQRREQLSHSCQEIADRWSVAAANSPAASASR